ncbi:MAG: sigma factor-like helix-turn-helix DNA-binding protein [Bacteroidales bacterium]|nr:sigma factor-like helix-turn-helix DNA-binding protein [Bacteroidales bacterium]MDD3200491.1 sigma factor-like helix-turn-helix DNA-binding protein [Bacteroidales bacterium]
MITLQIQDSLGRYLFDGVYYDIPESIIRLSEVQRQNTILTCSLIGIGLLIIASTLLFLRQSKKRKAQLQNEKLANSILKKSATLLPNFTDEINRISNKSMRLSAELFNEFQGAIDSINTRQKENISILVNDKDFQEKYPFINDHPSLSNQEKIIFVLYEQDFKVQEIATILNMGDNNVRAIKTKIKNKILRTTAGEQASKNYKIFK